MLEFNEQTYIQNMEKIWNLHSEVEKIADEVSKEGYDNIFFIAIGGSQAVISGVAETLKTRTTIPTYIQSASEILIAPHSLLTKKSLVITISKSGDTKETIEAMEYLKKQGIRIFSIVCVTPSPLSELSTYYIENPVLKGAEAMYLLLLFFTLRLLHNNKEYDQYNQFVEQMKNLPANFAKAKREFDPVAKKFTDEYKDSSYQLWIGGGNCWYETYSFAMCILEEMQWIRTKSVSSTEFFHGTLEIVEKDTCTILIKGLDKTRVLDDRVEKFVKTITDKLTIIDLKTYAYLGIDDEFYALLTPALMSCLCTERLAGYLARERNHPLDLRRYYRQLKY